uniref:Uncharacterized protein n=1 Tax=Anguilla anguilla TaxID=7936 RepID=A0A0E9UDC0_ANGAN
MMLNGNFKYLSISIYLVRQTWTQTQLHTKCFDSKY